VQPFLRSNLSLRGAMASNASQLQEPLPARMRPHLLTAGALVIAASAGFAVAQGQGNGFLLAYVAAMLFVLPILAGRPEFLLALVVGLCVVAVGPFARAEGSGLLEPSSVRLPLLIAASAAALLFRRGPTGIPAPAVLTYSSLLLFLAVGIPFSPDPSLGIQYLLKLCVPLAVAGAIASLGSYGVRFAEVIGLGALGVTLLVDYAMFAVGAGYYAPEGTDLMRFGGLSSSGPSTGFVLSLLGVFSLVLWLQSNRRIALILWAASFPILLVTFTRSGIAAWLIGSVAALLIARRIRLTVLFITIAVVVLLGNTTLADRSSTEEGGGWGAVITSIRDQGLSGINTTGRTGLWDENIRHFAEHPLAGNGIGASEYYTMRLTSGVLGQVHSEYLALLVGGGVVALSLWILSWIILARSVWLGPGKLAVSCIIAYALLAAVDSPISNYPQGGAMMGIALGWALAMSAARQVDEPTGRAARGAARVS
jgi:O-Antigen ligase